MAQTALQLFELNQRTLSQWFSRRQKEWERTVLQQAVGAPFTVLEQLLRGDEASGQPPFVFVAPQDRSRQATQHSHQLYGTFMRQLSAPLFEWRTKRTSAV
ncbi:hypothetical protein ANANG_G00283660 [Anguilla anguilla]|uniref:Uncharacterized protein n=1 Tax=Anguilla anguilla TaxID=7936 RepID=A0A9D3RL76_ANGAN|nr:hypothetical protein ANANG_G00283660 [Anguilla anguilla]